VEISKGTEILIAVTKAWNEGAHRFLSQRTPNFQTEVFLISGTFESLDSQGLWFKFHREDEMKTAFTLFVPSHHLLTIVLADDAEGRKEFKKFGY
jgi:hypothetical protein